MEKAPGRAPPPPQQTPERATRRPARRKKAVFIPRRPDRAAALLRQLGKVLDDRKEQLYSLHTYFGVVTGVGTAHANTAPAAEVDLA